MVKVECYSGHTYAERPTAFVWQGRRYQVERVVQQWRSPEGPGFRLLTADGERFELTYNEAQDEWSLRPLPTSERAAGEPPQEQFTKKENMTDA